MGLDELSFGPGELYIMDQSGETAMQMSVYDMQCEIPFSAEAEPNYEFEFRTPLAQEFTADSYIVDTGLLELISEQPRGFYLEYDADVQVQARRHRKKRIDKKWLKRYGYKTVKRRVRLNCEQLSINSSDGWYNIDVKGVSYGSDYQ